ncbi:hypothetical protein FBUS_04874 [Fasciolopsis buskii]|uniref:Outer dynein arm-docking complex subunit 4 n=1 Tax=Fasciolopsis buskii TaxID=27845 RepID=A0A8E0RNB1_9TREM|nr:hypothetical protein FBUS_04874 [Fasciolopsis buski]
MSEDSSERPAFKSVDAYYAIARTLQVKKEYQRALFYLALALRQDDKHIPSYLLRSFCYMLLCETDKALADVKTVLQYEPKNPHALLLLAEIYYLRGDFEEALTTFHQGVKLRPTIDHFMVGVHKCEAAIHNSCNDCKILLTPELDLTEFYLRAFPPKKQAKASKRICNKAAKSESTDDVGAWPPERPRDMQLQLMKQSFSDFSYLSNLFSAESEYKSVRKLLLYNYPHKANIIIAFKLGSP